MNLIKIETDDATTIAAASFIGEECFGVTRVQRERQPGESRRTRRKAPPAAQLPADAEAAVAALRDKYYADAVQRMREWGHAEHARQQAEAQRLAEEAAQRPASSYPPIPLVQVPRTRPAGTPPLAVSGLTTETLVLLELGEPLTYVCAAA